MFFKYKAIFQFFSSTVFINLIYPLNCVSPAGGAVRIGYVKSIDSNS